MRVIPGMLIKVRSGLHMLNNADSSIEISRDNLVGYVENCRETVVGSEDDHFETCYMVEMRLAGADGSYDPLAPLITFAQEGDFRPEFIDEAPEVLKRLERTYI